VERVTAALMYMDDSAGIVGDGLRTLMALYARAGVPARNTSVWALIHNGMPRAAARAAASRPACSAGS
jgi:hypothetical protein